MVNDGFLDDEEFDDMAKSLMIPMLEFQDILMANVLILKKSENKYNEKIYLEIR